MARAPRLKENTKQLPVRFPEDVYAEIERRAGAREGRQLNATTVDLVRAGLAAPDPQEVEQWKRDSELMINSVSLAYAVLTAKDPAVALAAAKELADVVLSASVRGQPLPSLEEEAKRRLMQHFPEATDATQKGAHNKPPPTAR